MICIICKTNETEGLKEYCDKCFSTAIDELDQKYGKKEGPSIPSKETREAPVSEPVTENTHH